MIYSICIFIAILSCVDTVTEGSIVQSVPEHPKREHIFALSTAFGDAYLFEVLNFKLNFVLVN